MKAKYGKKAHILFRDTYSLAYEITTDDCEKTMTGLTQAIFQRRIHFTVRLTARSLEK
jgi:hypothetical protein